MIMIMLVLIANILFFTLFKKNDFDKILSSI